MSLGAPFFNRFNTDYAYQLHYHIGFRTHHCVKALAQPERIEKLSTILKDTCDRSEFHILESEIDDSWIRLLLSLRPSHPPATAVRTIKSNTSRWMFEAFPSLEREMGQRALWAKGYFVRGVGDVTNATVMAYVARQRQHHQLEFGGPKELARYQHPFPERFLNFRSFSHCVAEYNCHLVCCPLSHLTVFEEPMAVGLLECIRRTTSVNHIELLSASILEDHVHIFASLRPNDSPDFLAMCAMNDTAEWMMVHNSGALKVWDVPGLWTPSAFVRTAGAATTNIVRNHLRSFRM